MGRTTTIGPGSVKVAHTATEHVEISELIQAVDLYQRLALKLLTQEEK